MAGLQDFFTHYKPDTSPAKSSESQASAGTTVSLSTSDDPAEDLMMSPPVMPSGECVIIGLALAVLVATGD